MSCKSLWLGLAFRCWIAAVGIDTAVAGELVEFKRNGSQVRVTGEILVEAQDGGLLIEAPDQVIWPVQPADIVSRSIISETLPPLDKSQLAARVLKELPEGFQVHSTAHYVICYNTTKAYAEWCGGLYERLYRAFTNYWSRRGLMLREPPPLVAFVFQNRKTYEDYGREELGDAVGSVIGYYSYTTNRIAMYDLTGVDQLREQGVIRTAAQVNQLLRRPHTERTVATIIHEATHQLAFNCGLHRRFADIPLWLSEGLAIYFEAPDLKSSRGWRTIGKVNRVRLAQFRRYTHRRPSDSLTTLMSSNDRFRTAGIATDAYAESWAWCFFLIRKYPQQFDRYLECLQAKRPLENDTPQRRLEDFLAAFEVDLSQLDRDFLRYIQRIK